MFKKRKKLTGIEKDTSIVNADMPNWLSISRIIIEPSKAYGERERLHLLDVIARRKDTPGSVLTPLAQEAMEDRNDPLLLSIVTHKNATVYVLNCTLKYVKVECERYEQLLRRNGTSDAGKQYEINSIRGESSFVVDPSAYWTLMLEAVAEHDNSKKDVLSDIKNEAINLYRNLGF